MKKKIVVGLVGVVVIAAVAGGFFWWENRLTPEEKWNMAKYSQPADFTVTETAEQKIIENKTAGLTFAIPKDWTASSTEYYFKLFSADAKEKNEISMDMDNGCRIMIEIAEVNMDLNALEKEIKNSVWGKYLTEYKRNKIDGRDAFQFITKSETLDFYQAGIMIPYKGKVLSVILDTVLRDSNMCLQYFENTKNSMKIQ